MCEFISWIETEREVLFLTAKDIDSEHGKKRLKGCLDNDFIGHGAIRRFYGTDRESLLDGTNLENQDFWNGKLPQEIKKAWNEGELDGMMKYLQGDDLEYIVNNAPAEFVEWTIAQKYGKDYDAMKKDSDREVRLWGMAATQDYAAMKKDDDWFVRLLGMAATQDYAAMKKDRHWLVRLAGMGATQDYDAMKKDRDWTVRLAGMAATQDYDAMKNDSYYWRFTVRLVELAAMQDYDAMKKDDDWFVRLVGMAATYDPEKLVRPRL